MKTMIVFRVGTTVLVGTEREPIPAIVTAISIRDGVRYECAWWDGRTRCEKWLNDSEVMEDLTPDRKTEKTRLGFADVHAP